MWQGPGFPALRGLRMTWGKGLGGVGPNHKVLCLGQLCLPRGPAHLTPNPLTSQAVPPSSSKRDSCAHSTPWLLGGPVWGPSFPHTSQHFCPPPNSTLPSAHCSRVMQHSDLRAPQPKFKSNVFMLISIIPGIVGDSHLAFDGGPSGIGGHRALGVGMRFLPLTAPGTSPVDAHNTHFTDEKNEA